MMNGKLFFGLLSFLMITNVLAMEKNNENDDSEEKFSSYPPTPVLADLKKADKKNIESHNKPVAWFAPTACAAGLLLNNQVSFKIAPACIGLLIGIGGGFLGQRYLDKNSQLQTGYDGEKEKRSHNFWIGASLKSIGWISTAIACNGIVNYVMKMPVFFNSVQALDKLLVTPGFSTKTPELAQLFQHNHIAAAGIMLAGVGLISNYFLTKPSKDKPERL